MPQHRTVLVAGSQGVIGRTAAIHWGQQEGTTVYGLSRREVADAEGVHHVPVDLLSPQDVQAKIGAISGVTHLVFAAYVYRPGEAEQVEPNLAMLRNLLDVLGKSPKLKHITLYQGGKAYGAHLGPFKTPGREDDPRHMPPNFYYDQEDLLLQRQPGTSWTWTIHRPEAVCGYSEGSPMNLGMTIAVYAAISKALDLPLRFPGTEQAYRVLYQITSADILARATVWGGTSVSAQNQIFNITNGDYFRWQHMWPSIARYFDMDTTHPLPIPLSEYMADKGPLWKSLVREHGLLDIPYEQVASWAFADAILKTEYDNITSTIKARRAGFHDCIETEAMFVNFFDELRRRKVIPPVTA
jgi:nucleoside-diphosphate-sugar epimerase